MTSRFQDRTALVTGNGRACDAPIVLLHGATFSARVWDDVVAAIGTTHEVLAPNLPGHRGGTPLSVPPRDLVDGIVDALCEYLDDAAIKTAHLVGNSLGGWVALELARRGRAASVLALSPAGGWRADHDLARLLRIFRAGALIARHPTTVNRFVRRPWARRVFAPDGRTR